MQWRVAQTWRKAALLVAILAGLLVPAMPAGAQDLFCEYDPSILVQTDQGPVLVHLFFRTSRLVDSRTFVGLADGDEPIRGVSSRLVRERGTVVAPTNAMLEYLEAHTYFRVSRVERRGDTYDIEVVSYVDGPARLSLTAYVTFDRNDPTSTRRLKPLVAPTDFLQQDPWIQPAAGFSPDVFSNFDSETGSGRMTTTIRLSSRDVQAQLARTRLAGR
ncbi:MAG: hypothetical protein U0556_12910 [Dehalococcoidia bacterium]